MKTNGNTPREETYLKVQLKLTDWLKLAALILGPALFTIRTGFKADANSESIAANSEAITQITASVNMMIRHDERIEELRRRVERVESRQEN